MNPANFKQQLGKCRSKAAVERLMQGWFSIEGTLADFQELRELVVAKCDEIDRRQVGELITN